MGPLHRDQMRNSVEAGYEVYIPISLQSNATADNLNILFVAGHILSSLPIVV